MKRIISIITICLLVVAVQAQTMNVVVGNVTYQFPSTKTGDMSYTNGTTLTVMGKAFAVNDINKIYIDDTAVTDNQVTVAYSGASATITIAGNVARYVTPTINGAHVSIAQSNTADVDDAEITYSLSGTTTDGEFSLNGSYKCTVQLNGLTLTNPNGAAINIQNSKRIQVSAKNGTVNTLTDGANGSQKACIYSKGQLQLQGQGTMNVIGNTAHAIKSGDYITIKNLTLNVTGALKDGISCNEYFLMKSGTVSISGIGDDGIQIDLDGTTPTGETTDHEDEDSGNIYLEGGTLTITPTANGAKGLKAAGDLKMSGGRLTVTQTGSIIADSDLSYPTSVKAGGNIHITGGTIIINNTADGGKGISADGEINIDESNATVNIDIIANGKGGTAEVTGTTEPETTISYKVYVSIPTSGGGGFPGGGSNSAWKSVYLYKSDGTLVQQLTSTVSKSSGYSTVTFYYYDFKAADSDTYYFKSDNYTSRNTTYTIKSATFSGPTSGSDVYYSISNSYQTSGSTRTYSITNVTTTYGGSSDVSDENGTAYNAMGIKADGNLTISGGTITVKNSGEMSKSLKSKATLTIGGGTITLTPSGAMKVINSDASYSTGIKATDFVMNGGTTTINVSGTAGKGISTTSVTTNSGTLNITNSGTPVSASSSDYYTAKGIKTDGNMALNSGTITIKMTGNGGKGIKVNGKYTQGISGGDGPTLNVTTTGSAAGGTSSGGGFPGGMGGSSSGSAKAIKVMGAITIYGGATEIYTSTNGAEGLESKVSVDIQGGNHYFKCYDDCINSSGAIYFNGGTTVCYSYGNDAVDSNYGRTGAITIGNGVVFAYTTKGSPEEGLDCDNNSYIQITGTGYAISAGGSQGGGWSGSSSSTISNAKQGYSLLTSTVSYKTNNYYTLADASGNNLMTYSFEAAVSSTMSLITAKGMVKGSTYTIKSSTTAPTDATTSWHGLYLGSSHTGTTSVTSFTAQ